MFNAGAYRQPAASAITRKRSMSSLSRFIMSVVDRAERPIHQHIYVAKLGISCANENEMGEVVGFTAGGGSEGLSNRESGIGGSGPHLQLRTGKTLRLHQLKTN